MFAKAGIRGRDVSRIFNDSCFMRSRSSTVSIDNRFLISLKCALDVNFLNNGILAKVILLLRELIK